MNWLNIFLWVSCILNAWIGAITVQQGNMLGVVNLLIAVALAAILEYEAVKGI